MPELKKKWKNLRDKYRIELSKTPNKKSGDGTDADVLSDDDDINHESEDESQVFSSWPYFNSLSFLKDQFTPRQNKGNLTSPQSESTQSICSPNSVQSSTDPAMLDPEDELFEDGTSRTSSMPSSSGLKRTEKYRKQLRPVAENDYKRELLQLEEKKLKLLEGESNNKNMAFFESLIPHLAKLSDAKQMLVNMEIQQIVYKHVYGSEQPYQPQQNPAVATQLSANYLPNSYGYTPKSQPPNYPVTSLHQNQSNYTATSQQQNQENYSTESHQGTLPNYFQLHPQPYLGSLDTNRDQ